MSLSPLSAIGDMVAPVVIITVAAFIGSGLHTAAITLSGFVLALERELMGILRGPHGEMLDEGNMPPLDRERLTQIRDRTARLARRIVLMRRAVLIIWISTGLLTLSVAAIAVASTAHSEAFAFTAMALVIAGVATMLAAVASMIGPTTGPFFHVIPPNGRTRGSG